MPSLASSVSGKLCTGDVVSVYAYVKDRDNENNGQVVLYPELTYVEIAAVSNVKAINTDTYTGEKGALSSAGGSDAVPATITLLVSQAQAKRLIEIENTGIAHVSLIGRGEAAIRQMNEYVIPVEEDARASTVDAWQTWLKSNMPVAEEPQIEGGIAEKTEEANPESKEETEG